MIFERHGRKCFYKYMNVATAKIVLSSRKLRWSSPLLFDDPFDHQVEFDLPFSEQEFIEAMMKEAEKIIFGDKEPKLPFVTSLGAMWMFMRKNASLKTSKSEILTELRRGAEASADLLSSFKMKVNGELRKTLEETRVFCVSEQNDNVALWAQYADGHRGVVLKLDCLEELDNSLLIAKKVTYQRELPVITTLNEFVKHATGEIKIEYKNLLAELAYIKHEDWAYQREWRVPVFESIKSELNFNDYREHPRVFSQVILGCRISEQDKRDILALLDGELAHTECCQAVKSKLGFGLSFLKIK